MDVSKINKVVSILKKEMPRFRVPAVGVIAIRSKDPFQVLISTVLSLRTKDEVTMAASNRLLTLADSPAKMMGLSPEKIERTIYPAGFYRTKARNILSICKDLIEKFDSKVPETMEELLGLRGVGRKTANLVLTLGHDLEGICVDVHVHRISNRLGFIRTKHPDESETALRKKLPRKHWKIYNDILVTFGQNICRPVSPFCSQCKVFQFCERSGVRASR